MIELTSPHQFSFNILAGLKTKLSFGLILTKTRLGLGLLDLMHFDFAQRLGLIEPIKSTLVIRTPIYVCD